MGSNFTNLWHLFLILVNFKRYLLDIFVYVNEFLFLFFLINSLLNYFEIFLYFICGISNNCLIWFPSNFLFLFSFKIHLSNFHLQKD